MPFRRIHTVGQRALTLRGAGRNLPLELVTDRHLVGLHPGDDLGPEDIFKCLGGTFDGTNDWGENASGFTGASDGKEGLFSCFFVPTTLSGNSILFGTAGGFNDWYFEPSGELQFLLHDSASGVDVDCNINPNISTGSTWKHILAAWTLATTTVQVYIDDVDVAVIITANNDTIDWTGKTHGLGANPGGGNKWGGDMAEVYLTLGETLDISVEANRRKFRDAAGKPVSLGADGSKPTGNQPILYNHIAVGGAADDLFTNLGTGGNWAINGALALSSTNPTD